MDPSVVTMVRLQTTDLHFSLQVGKDLEKASGNRQGKPLSWLLAEGLSTFRRDFSFRLFAKIWNILHIQVGKNLKSKTM